MLYFRSRYESKYYSHHKKDWLIVEGNELLTDREIIRYQHMGYNVKYFDFTPIITSQKNVKFVDGVRVIIDNKKVQPYN